MRFLVAIPVFNERQHVSCVLSRVLRLVDDVLVVDDGSTDGTELILDRTPGIEVIRHPTNLGYGRSLIDAFDYARSRGYDWVITMDCDDQHEPDRLPAFIEQSEQDEADIVSGSRYLINMPDNARPPSDRRRINAVITRRVNQVLGLALTDAFCGFKSHRVAAVERLSLTEAGYAFPLQFWVQAAYHGLRIRELPVRLIYNDPTRHFGGALDEPGLRLQHYLQVFMEELARTRGADFLRDDSSAPAKAAT